jgi:hypothetical protein
MCLFEALVRTKGCRKKEELLDGKVLIGLEINGRVRSSVCADCGQFLRASLRHASIAESG